MVGPGRVGRRIRGWDGDVPSRDEVGTVPQAAAVDDVRHRGGGVREPGVSGEYVPVVGGWGWNIAGSRGGVPWAGLLPIL